MQTTRITGHISTTGPSHDAGDLGNFYDYVEVTHAGGIMRFPAVMVPSFLEPAFFAGTEGEFFFIQFDFPAKKVLSGVSSSKDNPWGAFAYRGPAGNRDGRIQLADMMALLREGNRWPMIAAFVLGIPTSLLLFGLPLLFWAFVLLGKYRALPSRSAILAATRSSLPAQEAFAGPRIAPPPTAQSLSKGKLLTVIVGVIALIVLAGMLWPSGKSQFILSNTSTLRNPHSPVVPGHVPPTDRDKTRAALASSAADPRADIPFDQLLGSPPSVRTAHLGSSLSRYPKTMTVADAITLMADVSPEACAVAYPRFKSALPDALSGEEVTNLMRCVEGRARAQEILEMMNKKRVSSTFTPQQLITLTSKTAGHDRLRVIQVLGGTLEGELSVEQAVLAADSIDGWGRKTAVEVLAKEMKGPITVPDALALAKNSDTMPVVGTLLAVTPLLPGKIEVAEARELTRPVNGWDRHRLLKDLIDRKMLAVPMAASEANSIADGMEPGPPLKVTLDLLMVR